MSEVPQIGVSNLVKRQTRASKFSHFTGTYEELITRVQNGWSLKRQGEQENTFVVPVSPNGFHARARRRKKPEAIKVEVVVWGKEASGDLASTDKPFEIVSIHARAHFRDPDSRSDTWER